MASPAYGKRFVIEATCETEPYKKEKFYGYGSSLRIATQRAGYSVGRVLTSGVRKNHLGNACARFHFELIEKPHVRNAATPHGSGNCQTCKQDHA